MRTMGYGNCNKMNNDTAGKITSDVRGFVEIRAAVTKELNATSTEKPND